jgi:hypothetical protein
VQYEDIKKKRKKRGKVGDAQNIIQTRRYASAQRNTYIADTVCTHTANRHKIYVSAELKMLQLSRNLKKEKEEKQATRTRRKHNYGTMVSDKRAEMAKE